ncbi:FAD binding domain-containing protein [Allostreptomyces psammosilenae]
MPETVEEAVNALVAMPEAVPVAGGTDLMVAVNSGTLRPAALIGLGRIAGLRGWEYRDGHAVLGAGLTLARAGRPDFAALIPALAEAARSAGPSQTRNVATIGGNLVTAARHGDTLPVLAALDAVVLCTGPDGTREVPVGHLLTGMDPLRPAELVVAVKIPLLHAPQVFLKVSGRGGPSRAEVSVAIALDPARRAVRCAVGAVAPIPLRPLDAEGWVSGCIEWDGTRTIGPDACQAFGEYVAAACVPETEQPPGQVAEPKSTVDHRRRTVAALARRALGRVLS